MTFSWNIYTRIIHSIWHHTYLRKMAYICIITMAISAATLTIIAAIMHGFENHTHQQLQSIHPDITMHAPQHTQFNISQLHDNVQPYSHYIAALSAYAKAYAMVYHSDSDMFHAISCYAIDPEAEASTTALPRLMRRQYENNFSATMAYFGIILGAPLARYLRVRVGDTIYLGYQHEEEELAEPQFDYTTCMVVGTYETGIEEQDMYTAYISHSTYEHIWGTCDITQVGLRIYGNYSDTYVAKQLSQAFPGLRIRTWKDAYPAILSALQLEKYAMIAIFSLLLVLASISSIALLYMVVTTKSRECAILIAMGMSKNRIQWHIIVASFVCSYTASIVGIMLGAIISWGLDTYRLVPLPAAYCTQYLPAHVSPSLIGVISLITAIITCIAAWIPSRSIHTIDVARTLKEQG